MGTILTFNFRDFCMDLWNSRKNSCHQVKYTSYWQPPGGNEGKQVTFYQKNSVHWLRMLSPLVLLYWLILITGISRLHWVYSSFSSSESILIFDRSRLFLRKILGIPSSMFTNCFCHSLSTSISLMFTKVVRLLLFWFVVSFNIILCHLRNSFYKKITFSDKSDSYWSCS